MVVVNSISHVTEYVGMMDDMRVLHCVYYLAKQPLQGC
jgi:hypothetical protein